jgi:hypothetical protein
MALEVRSRNAAPGGRNKALRLNEAASAAVNRADSRRAAQRADNTPHLNEAVSAAVNRADSHRAVQGAGNTPHLNEAASVASRAGMVLQADPQSAAKGVRNMEQHLVAASVRRAVASGPVLNEAVSGPLMAGVLVADSAAQDSCGVADGNSSGSPLLGFLIMRLR